MQMNLCGFDVFGHVKLLNDIDDNDNDKKENEKEFNNILCVLSIYTINNYLMEILTTQKIIIN